MADEKPPEMTVGQLREALAKYPDDTPIRVAVPDPDHPDDVHDDAYVVSKVAVNKVKYHGQDWEPNPFVHIELEPHPAGMFHADALRAENPR
ncbi:DUF6225 family protein [Streptomyces alboflavus]|uniref:DUF6225 family protein n=1 Tax=Streptomyces alboflavus TaxID=67267 RepID=UPI0036CD096D